MEEGEETALLASVMGEGLVATMGAVGESVRAWVGGVGVGVSVVMVLVVGGMTAAVGDV